MVTAQEILKMIEVVNPDNQAAMDRIDCLVHDYLGNGRYDHFTDEDIYHYKHVLGWVPNYCFSRDALKAIRPEGWFVSVGGWPQVRKGNPAKYFVSGKLPTEELAELHAIIQAIAWEREHRD